MNLFSKRYAPLTVYLFYTMFVFIGLYYGPLQYVDIDFSLVTSYVIAVTVLFSLGFVFGSSKPIYSTEIINKNLLYISNKYRSQLLLNAFLFLGVIVAITTWVQFIGSGKGLSLSSLGDNYINSYAGYERGNATIDIFYVLNIFGHTAIALCLFYTAYYFSMYTKFQRVMFFFVCGTYLLLQVIASGKQKYLGDFVICFALFLAFYMVRSSKKISLKFTLLLFVSGLFIVFLFLEILRQRYASAGIGLENIDAVSHHLIYWVHDSVVFSILGPDYGFALGVFIGYFTNGIYGLSLCLQLPFEWTYFVGNSYSLTRIAEIIIGEKDLIAQHSYAVRASEVFGWDATKWHSLYSWMASDITFPGVVMFSGIFGFIYGRLWIESINSKYFSSGPLFCMLSLGIVFALANNQLMHSLSGVLSLLFVFFLWGSTKLHRGLNKNKRHGNYDV